MTAERTGRAAAAHHPEGRRASLRALAARIWRAAVANKGLVAVILVVATLEAFFTKAPQILVLPLVDAFQAPNPLAAPAGNATSFSDDFKQWFAHVSIWIRDLLGIEFAGAVDQKTTILGCAVVASIAGVIGGIFIYLSTLLTRFFATKIVVDLRNEIAQHLLLLPLRFFGRRRMGDLISNLTNNTTVLARSLTVASDHVIVDPLMILANFAILALFAPMVLPIFVVMLPLMALPMIRLGRKVHRRSGQSMSAMGDATEAMNQMLSGIKTVKAFQLEKERLSEFRDSNELYLNRTMRMLQAKGRSQALVFVGYQVAFAALVVALGILLLGDGIGVDELALIIAPMATTYTHVKRLSRVYNTFMESLGAMEGVEELLGEVPDPAAAGRGITLEAVRGDVAMKNVSFAYGDDKVLVDVSFEVERGMTVALVGPSGAGKSTILDLLARFYDPIDGQILIDGHDLKTVNLDSYRAHTAMVVQQPFLFNTSILENIRCGRPSADEAAVRAAADAAQIHDFIETLPKGYDTVTGERGSNLSGGQMQRITIARAILRDPAILFLDEATSSLDSESEGAVQEALNNLMSNRTCFVIAHRLSTISHADLILVLDSGRVVETGRHDQLIRRGGLYRRLIDLQHVG